MQNKIPTTTQLKANWNLCDVLTNLNKILAKEDLIMLVYDKEQIKKYLGYSAKDLNDFGICPTCFNKQTNNSVYGDDTLLKVYEDSEIECSFVANPRADGHMMIAPKEHYHDMAESTDEINTKIIKFVKQLMIIIKEVLYLIFLTKISPFQFGQFLKH